jgi:hypothetical protein
MSSKDTEVSLRMKVLDAVFTRWRLGLLDSMPSIWRLNPDRPLNQMLKSVESVSSSMADLVGEELEERSHAEANV